MADLASMVDLWNCGWLFYDRLDDSQAERFAVGAVSGKHHSPDDAGDEFDGDLMIFKDSGDDEQFYKTDFAANHHANHDDYAGGCVRMCCQG